nr:PREDICTED: organic cation/carnitine transporter 7-like [Megachile rotundata]
MHIIEILLRRNKICYIGMAIGAFLFGSIIDEYGRKRSIHITMLTVFCSMTTLSFAQTTILINLSLFVLGMGLAGNNVVLKVFLIELLPMKQRGSSLAVLDIFGVLGYISALGKRYKQKSNISLKQFQLIYNNCVNFYKRMFLVIKRMFNHNLN